jgi:fructose-bisphosphate aldolase, class II
VATSARDLLRAAREGGYAIGAFNAVNLETAQAIVRGAERVGAPVILQVSENAARYAGLEVLSALCRALREKASVPVILHFDHAESLASAERALALGFDSVMLETAHLAYGEAVVQLRQLADLARGYGVCVEGEAEVTAKGSRSQRERLTPEDIAAFARASRCDWLAADVGSRHKMVAKTAKIDLERLGLIAQATPLPLVLHGASGVPDADLGEAVRRGVAKVNVATELMRRLTAVVRAALADPDVHDPRSYLGAGCGAAEAFVAEMLGKLKTPERLSG